MYTYIRIVLIKYKYINIVVIFHFVKLMLFTNIKLNKKYGKLELGSAFSYFRLLFKKRKLKNILKLLNLFFWSTSGFGAKHQATHKVSRCSPPGCSPGQEMLLASLLHLFLPVSHLPALAQFHHISQLLSQLLCSSFPRRPKINGTFSLYVYYRHKIQFAAIFSLEKSAYDRTACNSLSSCGV